MVEALEIYFILIGFYFDMAFVLIGWSLPDSVHRHFTLSDLQCKHHRGSILRCIYKEELVCLFVYYNSNHHFANILATAAALTSINLGVPRRNGERTQEQGKKNYKHDSFSFFFISVKLLVKCQRGELLEC